MNISTLTYLPTIHILTSKINFWKSEFWDHLAKPLGCPLHYCCEAVLKPKKVPSASLVKMTLWTFVETHITNIEMKHDALLKIAVDMHSQFSPIWQIFLPVYNQPSKRASCFISNLDNLASAKAHRAIFTSEMLGTFFWCRHRLAIAVLRHLHTTTTSKVLCLSIFI